MMEASQIQIESRQQPLAWLGEAAEIEHNLMYCYLYAMFSPKRFDIYFDVSTSADNAFAADGSSVASFSIAAAKACMSLVSR